MGTLDRIDMVSKQSDKGDKFNRVFIHFHRWNNTENACVARERLLNGKEIKIIYDDPWFWKISAYREAERRPEVPSRNEARRPTLQFDSDEDRSTRSHDDRSRHHHERPRNDSRERPKPRERPRPRDDRPRPHHERPRPHDDRPRPRDERPRPRDDRPRPRDERPRPRDERPRPHHERPRRRDESPVKNHQDDETFTDNHPTRIGHAGSPIAEEFPLEVNYSSNIVLPTKKRKVLIKRNPTSEEGGKADKPLKIEEDLEDGEVEEK